MYDRERVCAAHAAQLRLLPWETPEGKPCFLSTDDPRGLLSHLADDMEEAQLRAAMDALAHARTVLEDRTAGPLMLRVALRQSARALGDTLRVADSRGTRLPDPGDDLKDPE